MNVLGALMSLLVDLERVTSPLTNSTGGTSEGNPSAGSDPPILLPLGPLSSRDRAGAGVLTAVVIVGMISTMLWMTTGASERATALGVSEKGKGRRA